MGVVLEAREVSMSFDGSTILDGISLEIEEGVSVAITGPSGVGKSTLLSILGLMLEPSSGEVLYRGKAVSRESDKERSQIRNAEFGFVFQSTQLIGSLNSLENVLVPALLGGRGGKEGRARELLEEMGLAERLYHYPHQLSVGQQRRVSIARALLLEPRVVFADEPTNDLDPNNAESVGDILYGFVSRGGSLVVATHDMSLASRSDRVYRMVSGGDGSSLLSGGALEIDA